MSRERTRISKGFTLVELLVVIGIIALLISILLPTLGKARKSANTAKDLSNLRQMATAATLMATERKGFIQTASDDQAAKRADPRREKFIYRSASPEPVIKDWASAMMQYMGGDAETTFDDSEDFSEVFLCPEDDGPGGQGPSWKMGNNTLGGGAPLSYGINLDIAAVVDPTIGRSVFNNGAWVGVYGGRNVWDTGNLVGESMDAKLSNVKNGAETLLFADCGTTEPAAGPGLLDQNDVLVYTTNYMAGESSIEPGEFGTLAGIAKAPWLGRRIPYARHSDTGDRLQDGTWQGTAKINIGFVDGHAETVRRGEFQKVRVSPFDFPPEP